MRRHSLVIVAAATALTLAACSSPAADPATDSEASTEVTDLSIIVPAEPGGGWDQTGRAMSETLTAEGIVDSAPVTNIGGAGGTVGLASLANEKDPHTLMVTGLVMVGAVETNAAQNRMEDTTPIARLTEEALVVVVPADSKYKNLEDLVEDIVENGQDVSVTGGSAGGADHILAGLLLEEAGLSGTEIAESLNYIPNSGGGEAVNLILGNNAAAGISGIGEFVEHIESGTMRALAVSSAEPAENLPDVPTITDEGYDVTLTNWRGVLAPTDISDADRDALIATVTELHDSGAWTEQLETRGWADAFLTGDEFETYLDENITEVTTTLTNIGLVG
ncbi:Bug family tripartite tricarboxylate transporter substrate binding protein [Mycetocola zhujimingii]|uniref:Bug family tripartite tricarboxylate transporter substrate binding protein n=1 Tax=Mycetocola zhujimingii TaxID=2079792 RepID=UPI000D37C456|nr:tripartite tricarboxylate transporter substrate-binding protein [Mycetocola zhujimingii]AWB86139.1 C4-dicarboxylate ABC transporter substrate-binding protein [Mycetocola zhujimingii]